MSPAYQRPPLSRLSFDQPPGCLVGPQTERGQLAGLVLVYVQKGDIVEIDTVAFAL